MRFDVVIVGTSTAGLYAAQLLALQGVKTAVFDRKTTASFRKRTLIVTNAFQNVVNSGTPEAATVHSVRTMEVTSKNACTQVKLEAPDPVVERETMNRKLLDDAARAGCSVHFGCRFSSLRSSSSGLTVKFQNSAGAFDVLVTRALIGADGACTTVGLESGLGLPNRVPIMQAQLPIPAGWDPDLTKIWFFPEKTPYFYWLIPESSDRGVIGLIGDKVSDIRGLLDSFVSRFDLAPETYQSAQVAIYHPKRKTATKISGVPVLLVGDAAGHVKNTTVGGTVTGLAGAQAAAKAILKGTRYEKELRSLERELYLHWLLRWALNRLDAQGYDELIQMIDGRVETFLGKYHRDAITPVFWRLPVIEPGLLKIGLRCLRNTTNPTDPGLPFPPKMEPVQTPGEFPFREPGSEK